MGWWLDGKVSAVVGTHRHVQTADERVLPGGTAYITDLGMTGPPLSYSIDFIAGSLVEMIGGLACASVLFGFAWWATLVLGGAWI